MELLHIINSNKFIFNLFKFEVSTKLIDIFSEKISNCIHYFDRL